MSTPAQNRQQHLLEIVEETYKDMGSHPYNGEKAIAIRRIIHEHKDKSYTAHEIAEAFGLYEATALPTFINLNRSTPYLLCLQQGDDLLYFNALEILQLMPAVFIDRIK